MKAESIGHQIKDLLINSQRTAQRRNEAEEGNARVIEQKGPPVAPLKRLQSAQRREKHRICDDSGGKRLRVQMGKYLGYYIVVIGRMAAAIGAAVDAWAAEEFLERASHFSTGATAEL